MRIIDYFDSGVAYYPDRVAFIDIDAGGVHTSYREARERSLAIADGIAGNDYGKGSHVGILAPNSTLAVLTLLGLRRSQEGHDHHGRLQRFSERNRAGVDVSPQRTGLLGDRCYRRKMG